MRMQGSAIYVACGTDKAAGCACGESLARFIANFPSTNIACTNLAGIWRSAPPFNLFSAPVRRFRFIALSQMTAHRFRIAGVAE